MRILVVDDRVPDPHFGAGFPRAYRLLLSLIQLGHQIVFFPTLKQTIKELNLDRLKSYGIEVVESIESLKDQDVSLAILSRPHNVHYYLPEVRKFLPAAKVVYDTEALWYRRYDLQLEITGRLPGWAYRYDELGMARAVDYCWVVNGEEKGILHENGVQHVRVLPHALDPVAEGQAFADRKDVLVVGGILEEDSSNEDALWWYLENCWGAVEGTLGCKLDVTGKSHSPRLLASKLAGLTLMGHVGDLSALYQSHKVFVATTRFATGIPWKVHEAMANGIPCVISKLLADQLGVTDGKEALVCNTAQEAVDKTFSLYTDSALWASVREEAYGLVRRDCDPEKFKGIIAATLGELGL
jgi:O-antigen biosynthesis protein